MIIHSQNGLGSRHVTPGPAADDCRLVANVNFFSKVTVDEAGRLAFQPNNSTPGDFVDLRAEMDTLVVLNTCPHPLDPSREWSPKPVELTIYRSDPVADCRSTATR